MNNVLLQVDKNLLLAACTQRTIDIGRGNTRSCPVATRAQAINFRDKLAQMVYDRLFMWIIQQTSAVLSQGVDSNRDASVGVLHMMGFEFYDNQHIRANNLQVVNGLDQLHVNICNEVLQQQFVQVSTAFLPSYCLPMSVPLRRSSTPFLQVNFGLEMANCRAQQVEISFTDFADNKYACDFLTSAQGPLMKAFEAPEKSRKTGKAADMAFLAALKKESKAKKGGPDNTGWVDKQGDQSLRQPGMTYLDYDKLRGRRVFNGINGGSYGSREINGKFDCSEVKLIDGDFVDKGAGMCPAFGIRHYAAEVSYDCRGWIEQDKNNPTAEMQACLASSADTVFMQPVFSAPPTAGSASLTRAFVTSLMDLMNTLNQSDVHYVRCLKASMPLQKRTFQSALVLNQLKYTGTLDTLKICSFARAAIRRQHEGAAAEDANLPEAELPADLKADLANVKQHFDN